MPVVEVTDPQHTHLEQAEFLHEVEVEVLVDQVTIHLNNGQPSRLNSGTES